MGTSTYISATKGIAEGSGTFFSTASQVRTLSP